MPMRWYTLLMSGCRALTPWMHLQPVPLENHTGRSSLFHFFYVSLGAPCFPLIAMAMLFLVYLTMLVAAGQCDAEASMASSACHNDGSVALLQSSAKEVRLSSLPRPSARYSHQQLKWEWGKSGGFVKWNRHSIALAFDASLYKAFNRDLAPTSGPLILRVVLGIFVIWALSNILVILMLILLVPTAAVVQAAWSIMPKGKSKQSKNASKAGARAYEGLRDLTTLAKMTLNYT